MKDTTLKKEVLSLVWPAVIQGLLSTIILFSDRLILGQYSDLALGSMQVSGPLMWSLFSLFGAYGSGVLAIIGRSMGASDHRRASQTLGTALCIGLALGTIVGCLGFWSAPSITAWMLGTRTSESLIAPMSITYLKTVMLSGPLILMGAVTTVAFQASGDTKTPMWLTLFSGCMNLLVSWILVFGIGPFPEWGILGAAIGTACATTSNALLGLLLVYIRKQKLYIGRPSFFDMHAIFRISWASFGEKILFHSGFLIFAAYIGRLGDIEMTTHQSLMAIESLGYIGAHAFGIAAGTLVAQQLGKKNPQRAEESVWFSATVGVYTLCAIGLFFVLFATPLIRLFSTDPLVLSLGIQCMYVAGVAQPLMAITDVFGGALRGAGDTKTPMKVAIVGPLILRPLLCYLLCFHFSMGLVGIWIGSTADWLVRSLWLYFAFRKGAWKEIEV